MIKKRNVLLLVLVVIIFILIYPEISFGQTTIECKVGGGSMQYQLPCGEIISLGSCNYPCCRWICDQWDADDNCIGCECDRRCYRCNCSNARWNEYRASPDGCNSMIQIRECWVERSGNCDAASGCPSSAGCTNHQCCVVCSDWDNCEECGSWQKAERIDCPVTNPGQTKPDCKCRGDCIQAPTGLRYYNNPNYPTNPCSPEAGVGPTNINLPVKLWWRNVEGWKDGWCGGGGYQMVDACGIQTTIPVGSLSPVQQCVQDKKQACIEQRTEEVKADPGWDDLSSCQKNCALAYARKSCHDSLSSFQRECVELCFTYSTSPPYYTPKPCTSEPPDPDDIEGCPPTTPDCPLPNRVYNPAEMVQYYEITITGDLRDSGGNSISSYTERLDQPEFIPPHPCFFKSNGSYEWGVRACCGNGQCGPTTTSTFSTSWAPEPVWHYDPDWVGPDRAEPDWSTATHEGFPVELSWCEVEEAVTYIVQAYENGTPYCPTILCPYCPGCEMLFHPEGLATFQSTTGFFFDLDSFTKETLYSWKIATCFNDDGTDCSEFGQLWKFYGFTELAKVELISPEDGGCVNFSSRLEWKHVGGARSYRYRIEGVPALQNVLTTTTTPYLGDIWNNLSLNTTYTWKVKACWDDEGNDCEDNSWSDEWQFTTTGEIPTGLDVAQKDPDDGRAVIPIKLDWDDMPCAASYKYELTAGAVIIAEGATPSSNLTIKYDSAIGHPQQSTEYSFRVWTCAKYGGEECGNEAFLLFETFDLKAPQNPHPPDGGEFYTYEYYLNWSSVLGGAFYQYEVTHLDTGEKIGPNIVEPSNVFVDTSKMELGAYTWWVKACLDENCDHYGPASTWTFELVEGGVPGGLVPCGRYANNPNTPWNEREACGIKHIFIMIYLIISYVLWKLIPIVLILLTIASAIIFYFSGQLGISDPAAQVKSIWKAVGIGLLVIFLAWIIVSVILGIFGYKVGIFGTWWILDF